MIDTIRYLESGEEAKAKPETASKTRKTIKDIGIILKFLRILNPLL